MLRALRADQRSRICRALSCLAEDPYRPRPGCDIQVLKGLDGVRAVRIGGFRAAYEVESRQVTVRLIAHRKNVYDF